MHYATIYAAPMGRITLASDGESLTGLWLQGQKYFGATIAGEVSEEADLPVLDRAKRWLDRYFAGARPKPTELPLAPAGSAFRQAVWCRLLAVPYGQVVTYGDIARDVAAGMGRAQMSSQAVGGAVGHNPISIVIPCHRVIGANGSLTGYAGGIQMKQALLRLEGVNDGRLSVPKWGTAL